MIAFVQAIWNAVLWPILQGVFFLALGTVNRARPIVTNRITIATVAGTLISIPFYAIIKALTGWLFFGYLAVVLALIATIVIWLLWAPIGVLLGSVTGDGLDAGNRYVRRLAVILFGELMVSLVFLGVPLHQNIYLIPAVMASALAAGIGIALWGGGPSPRRLAKMALITTVVLLLSFFFPRATEALGNATGGMDSTLASVLSGNVQQPATVAQQPQAPVYQPPTVRATANGPVITVALRGTGQASEAVDLDQLARTYPGYYYTFEGSRGTEVEYIDGPRGPITNDYGVRGGRIVFYGPAGGTVTIRLHP